MLGKRPRHYAREILKIEKREDRAKALEAVPARFRPIVQEHVITAFRFRK